MFRIRLCFANVLGFVGMMSAIVGDFIGGRRDAWCRCLLALPFDLVVLAFTVPAIWLCPVPGLVELALVRGRADAEASVRASAGEAIRPEDLN